MFESVGLVLPDQEVAVRTADTRAEVIIPAGALLGTNIEVRIRSVAVEDLPKSPPDVLLVHGIQLDTMKGDTVVPVPFRQAVTLTIFLDQELLATIQAAPETLRVLRYRGPDVGWEPLETRYIPGPPARLEAIVPGFSYFALAVEQRSMPAATATPTPTAEPTAVPPVTPTPTATRTPQAPAGSASTPSLSLGILTLVVGAAMGALAAWAYGRHGPGQHGKRTG